MEGVFMNYIGKILFADQSTAEFTAKTELYDGGPAVYADYRETERFSKTAAPRS